MALIDLKSNLSWYSSNGNTPGYKPNADVNSTNFVNNEDLTLSAQPRGFDNAGAASTYPTRTSLNQFYINSANSFQGTATRKGPLGQGSIFPTSPDGTVFSFDKTRTGFNITNKYSDTYNSLSSAGLADTYTIRKPINAMYNKFKVRDEVYDPFGDPAPPFILRGIQRDDNISPQRFGDGGVQDVPRGGPKTADERAQIDVDRLTKFMLRPTGKWFIEKQNQLHLMYPTREGVDGRPQEPSYNANSPKVFDIQNLLNQVGKVHKGEHDRKHGQFPYDTPGFLPFPPSPPSNYEDIHKERALGITQSGKVVSPTDNNRLVILRKEALFDEGFIDGIVIGGAFTAITNLSYDGKVTPTAFKRFLSSIPVGNAKIPTATKFGVATSVDFTDIRGSLYTYYFPYYSRGLTLDVKGLRFRADQNLKDAAGPFRFHPGLERRYATLLEDTNLRWKAHENERDDIAYPDDTDLRQRDGQYVNPEAFSLIQKGNTERKNAGPGYSKFTDFRAYESKAITHEPNDTFAIDFNTDNSGGPGGRTEAMLTRLKEDKPEGERFDGVGISDRTKNELNIASVDVRDTFDGAINAIKSTESEYLEIGQAAAERKQKPNTVIDFRTVDGEKYGPYKGAVPGEDPDPKEPARARLDTFKDYPGKENIIGRNAPLPVGNGERLQTYKRLTYGQIRAITKDRQPGTTAIIDFATGKELEAKFSQLNNQVNNSDLIVFSFNGIKFKGYITQISDSFTPGLSAESDQNRADPRYLYTSFERGVTITFMVAWEKSSDNPWTKLKQLADLTLPKYAGGPFAQRVDVTIGGLFRKIPMLIESLTYDWDNETPWVLNNMPGAKPGERADGVTKGKELPMYTSVSISLKYMGNVKPKAGAGYVKYGE